MPWTIEDVEKHKADLDQAGKEKWVKVANSALTSCLKNKKEQKFCEGYAIRVASGIVKATEGEFSGEPLESFEKEINAIRDAFDKSGIFPLQENGYSTAWVKYTFPNKIIVVHKGSEYEIPYTKDESGNFQFGEKKEVKEIVTITPKLRDSFFYIALSDPGDEELSEHKIFYTGKFEHGVYGKFNVDEKILENAVKNFNAGAGVLLDEKGEKELNCTYEHPPSNESDPEKTKSSGRIRKLFLKDGALYALIRWTKKAKEYIRNKEFTHVSPTFAEDWEDENGKSRGFTIRGLGLTNVPFLKKEQMAIALSETDLIYINEQEDQQMDKKIHEILGLKEDGNVAEAVKELKDKAAKVEDLEKQIKTLTDQDKEVKKLQAQVTELTEKLEASKPKDGEVKLTQEQFKNLQDGVKTALELSQKLELKEANELVDQAIKEFKILPAQREQARKMALTDRPGFTEFIKNAKPVIDAKEHGSEGDGESADPVKALTDRIQKIADEKKIGFTEAKRILKAQDPKAFKEAGY